MLTFINVPVTPETFIDKWRASTLKERSGSQSHFIDLCALLGVESRRTLWVGANLHLKNPNENAYADS